MIKLKNITKKNGDAIVLDNLSLSVDKGECLALSGPSGCGKTTTLRLIAGLEIPDSGEIWLKDTLASTSKKITPPYNRSLSMVFQDLALWPHMTALKHLQFSLGSNKKRDKSTIKKVLGMVRLTNHTLKYPHELSGGEKQRLALARALVMEPDILLMDEPLSSLDAALKKELLYEIKDIIHQTGITTIYVTHDLEEAKFLAKRIAIMADNNIKEIQTIKTNSEKNKFNNLKEAG